MRLSGYFAFISIDKVPVIFILYLIKNIKLIKSIATSLWLRIFCFHYLKKFYCK